MQKSEIRIQEAGWAHHLQIHVVVPVPQVGLLVLKTDSSFLTDWFRNSGLRSSAQGICLKIKIEWHMCIVHTHLGSVVVGKIPKSSWKEILLLLIKSIFQRPSLLLDYHSVWFQILSLLWSFGSYMRYSSDTKPDTIDKQSQENYRERERESLQAWMLLELLNPGPYTIRIISHFRFSFFC